MDCEADLSASTITDDYELSADFRHLELRDVVGCARERWRWLRVTRRRAEAEAEAEAETGEGDDSRGRAGQTHGRTLNLNRALKFTHCLFQDQTLARACETIY